MSKNEAYMVKFGLDKKKGQYDKNERLQLIMKFFDNYSENVDPTEWCESGESSVLVSDDNKSIMIMGTRDYDGWTYEAMNKKDARTYLKYLKKLVYSLDD